MESAEFEIIEGYKLRRKVRAVIVNERKEFLLIQPHTYETNGWTLVGGGVEVGEDYEQAIKREMLEETGIRETKNLLLSKEIHWFCFSDSIKAARNLDYDGQIARIFWASVSSVDVNIQTEEIRDYCWAQADEVGKLITVSAQKELFYKIYSEFMH